MFMKYLFLPLIFISFISNLVAETIIIDTDFNSYTAGSINGSGSTAHSTNGGPWQATGTAFTVLDAGGVTTSNATSNWSRLTHTTELVGDDYTVETYFTVTANGIEDSPGSGAVNLGTFYIGDYETTNSLTTGIRQTSASAGSFNWWFSPDGYQINDNTSTLPKYWGRTFTGSDIGLPAATGSTWDGVTSDTLKFEKTLTLVESSASASDGYSTWTWDVTLSNEDTGVTIASHTETYTDYTSLNSLETGNERYGWNLGQTGTSDWDTNVTRVVITQAVPEPSSYAMILGLAMLSLPLLHRRGK